MILRLKSSRLSYILVLLWPLSSNSRDPNVWMISIRKVLEKPKGEIRSRNPKRTENTMTKRTKILSKYIPFLQKRSYSEKCIKISGQKQKCQKYCFLIRSLKKFIFRYQDLVEIYSISAEKITLHNESIARCKHHMQEKLVYCCTYLENLWF
jgi:hypothetical protein